MADTERSVAPNSPDSEKEAVFGQRRVSVPEKVSKHAHDADEAMKAFTGHEGEPLLLDEPTSKRLLKKIDLHLMPVGIVPKGIRTLTDQRFSSFALSMA